MSIYITFRIWRFSFSLNLHSELEKKQKEA